MSDIDKPMDGKTGCLLAIIGLLLIVPNSLLSGWVVSKLWAWFIVPTFGLPALGVVQAIGMVIVVHTLKGAKYEPAKADRSLSHAIEGMVFSFTWPLLVLGIGAFWKNFM